jgi:hypothetical protein
LALFYEALSEPFGLLLPVVDPGVEPLDSRLELCPLGDLVRDLGPGASQVAVLFRQSSLPLGHPVAFGSELSTEAFRLGVVSRQALSVGALSYGFGSPDPRTTAPGSVRFGLLRGPILSIGGLGQRFERERNLSRNGSGRHPIQNIRTGRKCRCTPLVIFCVG